MKEPEKLNSNRDLRCFAGELIRSGMAVKPAKRDVDIKLGVTIHTNTNPIMKNLIAALSLSLVSLSACAATPSDESLRTLFSVMKTESIVNGIYAAIEPAMRQGMAQATAGKEPTAEQKIAMDRVSQRVGDVMRTELNWEKLEPIQIRIYRESFEQVEIDGLIEFYRSPVGKSFVNKMPVVTQKAMQEMQIYMQQVLPKMQAAMQEMINEVKSTE